MMACTDPPEETMRPILLLLLCLPSVALASPWTLPAGKLIFTGRYDFQIADQEFLDDRKAQVYPLRGEYRASTYAIGARFGAADGIELEIDLPLKQVSYTADPVILLENGDVNPPIEFFQDNIINLNRSASGIGDLRLAGRYRLTRSALASALQIGAKIPTGYDPPEGTFGAEPGTREEFIAQIGDLVRPDRVSDDVTLGDGQIDLDLSLLLGWATAKGTFVRLDTGYRLRLGGAGDQVFGAFRVGQKLGTRALFYVGFDAEYTVLDGDLIGVSVAADDPTLPANEYFGTENLLLRELRLERDVASMPVGLIVRITDTVEVNASWAKAFWGRNVSAAHVVSLAIGLRTDTND